MAKPIFTWLPDEGGEENIEPNVSVTGFGDGYEQRVPKGINPEEQTWSVTFTGHCGVIIPIREFLKARGAVEGFIWTNPFEETGVYVARKFTTKKITPEIMQVGADFELVYESME
ncbi:MAG: phage tail protein [Candidatus Binatia bacterium]